MQLVVLSNEWNWKQYRLHSIVCLPKFVGSVNGWKGAWVDEWVVGYRDWVEGSERGK